VERRQEKKNPRQCAHRMVKREVDGYFCVDCDTEFVPKNPHYATKWSDDPTAWTPSAQDLQRLYGK
jgi:hypothetical protein